MPWRILGGLLTAPESRHPERPAQVHSCAHQGCPIHPVLPIRDITAPTEAVGICGLTHRVVHNEQQSLSGLIAHIFIDGVEVGSDLLEPGETTPDFPLESPCPHTVGVQAEGIEGGCNHGAVSAWGATLHFKTTLPLS